jgi:hypothetical protein
VEGDELVRQTLDALDRLMRLFAMERIIYLLCSVVSFVMLTISVAFLLLTEKVSTPQLGMIFGASGLSAASAARVSYYLSKSFDLVSTIIHQLAARRNG